MNEIKPILASDGQEPYLLGVVVASDAVNLRIITDAMGNWLIGYKTIVILPKGNWELIGDVNKNGFGFDVTEYFDCREFNHLIRDETEKFFQECHKKVFAILQEKDIYLHNPLGNEPPDPNKYLAARMTMDGWDEHFHREEYERDSIAWRNAQLKVIDRLVILKRIRK